MALYNHTFKFENLVISHSAAFVMYYTVDCYDDGMTMCCSGHMTGSDDVIGG